MKRRFNRTQRNYIIAGLCMILVIMGVGYAAFQSQLRISGTSSISSSWNIQITNIETMLPSESGGSGIPDGYNISEPTYTPSSATFSAGFELPGSMIGYLVEVSNLGSIDGQVTIGNLSCGDNSAIMCQAMATDENQTNGFEFQNGSQDYSSINFPLKVGEKHYIMVMVGYDDVTEQPTDLDASIKLDLTYEQYKDPNAPIPSGETTLIGGQEVDIVSGGNGLYKDEYESGRYIYRGQDPDNYITFNGETWRIIAKETDGTYKIIRNDVLANRAFDEANHRTTEKNSYCDNPRYGCGVYSAVSGTFSSPSGSQSGTVTEDSSIKLYLNDDYYTNNINATAKGQMISHSFNIGAVEFLNESGAETDSIEKNIVGEKMYQWTGNVGLANVSDILKASTNPLCTSATTSYSDFDACNSNYLLDRGSASSLDYWTINASSYESGGNSYGVWGGYVNSSYARVYSGRASGSSTRAPRPVVFLKSDITLNGSGTLKDPFTIV